MPKIQFDQTQKIARMIAELPLDEREKVLARAFHDLPVEARSRVLGLSDSSLTVVTGEVVNLNREIAVMQNSNSNFDPEALVKALIEYRHQH